MPAARTHLVDRTGRVRRLTVALTGTALLALAGCSGETDAAEPTIVTGRVPSEDVLAAPEDGLDTALERLPGLAESLLEETGVPGLAVAVVHEGETVFAEGYGVTELGRDDPVTADTVFQVASLSKPVGATVVATQVSQGVVDWETPLASLLPDVQLADPWVTGHVTVADLYSHRSGLPHAAGDDLEDIGHDRSYVLDHLRHLPLGPFRSGYAYANFGMTLGAEAVATAAGATWEDLAEQELFGPLGMTSTSFRYDDFTARDERATLHALIDGEFRPEYQRDADAQAPAGGLSSTVVDLAEWMKLVLAEGSHEGEVIIEPEALRPALTPAVVSGAGAAPGQRASHYGHGFNIGSGPGGRVVLSHSGAFVLGAATTVQLVPDLDVGIVVLTNAGPVGAAEALAAQFVDLVQFGTLTRDWVGDYGGALAGYYDPVGDLVGEEPPADEVGRELEAYVGEYANDYFGPARVSLEDGQLVVALGPADYVLPLRPWDLDTFAFVPTGENAPAGSLSSARFEFDGDRPVALTLEFFHTHGLGTWTR